MYEPSPPKIAVIFNLLSFDNKSRARPQCNNHVVIGYCTRAVLLHCGRPVLAIFIIAKGQLAYCTESVVPYCHQSGQPLVSRAKTFPSLTVRYALTTATMAATWFRSIATQPSHCLAGSLSFSMSVYACACLKVSRWWRQWSPVIATT